MANQVKYMNQTISVNSNNERLSTNGYYTGEHKGSVMQDAAVNGTETAHGVEAATVRYGTMTQDAANGSMPVVGIAVTHKMTFCTVNDGDGVYTKNGAKTFTYTADAGKELPNSVTVKIGGETATSGTDYTYTKAAGTVAFAADKLSADTEITVVCA